MYSAASKTPAAKGDEFPILCETCLGPNPYIRMLKQPWGTACKVCERPFTSFRWRPAGHGTRPKKTEICQTCARAKNVCQTCLLDLQFGLPVQVRDASMAVGDRQRTVVPQSDGTREYAAAMSERKIATGEIDAVYKAPMVNSIAEKAKRIAPKYERNLSRICSFYARGECKRGLYCPYRHEKAVDETEAMGDQNLRDRYYGVNDPVAKKILQSMDADGRKKPKGSHGRGNLGAPPVPDDDSIQTLFIGGVTPAITEADLRDLFSKCEGLSHISRIPGRGFAFAEFKTRAAAELAIESTHGFHDVNGARVKISWGKSSRKRPQSDTVHINLEGQGYAADGSQQPLSATGNVRANTEPSLKRARIEQNAVREGQLSEVENQVPLVTGKSQLNTGSPNLEAGKDQQKINIGLPGTAGTRTALEDKRIAAEIGPA